MNKVIKILFSILVFLMILIILFMYKNSFASFISKITGNTTTKVSEPVFLMQNSAKKILNDENTEIDYYFTVKNFIEEGKRSENDLKYTIEVTPKLNSSIILTLYKDDIVIPLNNQKTDYIEMKHNTNQTHTYKLHIKYDREKTNETVDIKENIYIKAKAVQS